MAYNLEYIYRNIRYHENLIRSYKNTINELNGQINELITLKGKLQSYQRDFSARESNRKNRLVNRFGSNMNFRFLSSYISGMRNLISGSEYRKAYNGISSGITRVNTQISQLRGDVKDYNDKIRYSNKQISFWKRQIKYANH